MYQRMLFSNDELDFTYPLPAYLKNQSSCYIYVQNGKLVVHFINSTDSPKILYDNIAVGDNRKAMQYIGVFDKKLCYAIGLEPHEELPEDTQLIFLRELIGLLDERMLALAGRALQLIRI